MEVPDPPRQMDTSPDTVGTGGLLAVPITVAAEVVVQVVVVLVTSRV
jgi:hypothetical protein